MRISLSAEERPKVWPTKDANQQINQIQHLLDPTQSVKIEFWKESMTKDHHPVSRLHWLTKSSLFNKIDLKVSFFLIFQITTKEEECFRTAFGKNSLSIWTLKCKDFLDCLVVEPSYLFFSISLSLSLYLFR